MSSQGVSMRIVVRNGGVLGVLVALNLMVAGNSDASLPIAPLPIPLYSFDADSPTVLEGVGVRSDSVLRKDEVSDIPQTFIRSENLGMGQTGDELDCMSFNRGGFPTGGMFVLLFSVDRETTGNVPPDPALEGSNVPFNVADQVVRGHAAGDAFLALVLFDRNGIVPILSRGTPTNSNTQGINNYDEGGRDFQAKPPTSSRDYVTAAEDNVNSMASTNGTMGSNGFRGVPGSFPGIYFSASSDSPSLPLPALPGNSGADIFFNPDPIFPGTQQLLYAAAADLGLSAMPPLADEIDAMVVFDENTNGVFDFGDIVLFSLAPGSVSLLLIPDASTNGAADVFAVRGQTGGNPPVIEVFANAANLGLKGPLDNIDALEIVACTNAIDCAALAGIRLFKGDWDNDGDIDVNDLPAFEMCLSGPKQSSIFVLPPPLCRDVFDFNKDTDVDLADFAAFQRVFGFVSNGGGP